jgi:hypothetical protein
MQKIIGDMKAGSLPGRPVVSIGFSSYRTSV